MTKITHFLMLLLLVGFAFAQSPVIYSESKITMVSPGVYQTWNCANSHTDVWTDSTYVSYHWSSGDTTNRITLNGFGSWFSPYYNLTLTVTDSQGVTSSSVLTADSLYYPFVPYLYLFNNTFGCTGTLVAVGTEFTPNFEQLVWTSGHVVNTLADCHSTFQGDCFENFAVGGDQGLDRIIVFTGCHYPQTITVPIFPYPATPTISQSHDTLFADVNAPQYKWYNSNLVSINGETRQYFKPPVSGNYSVRANGSGNNLVACLSGYSNVYNYTAPLCTANYTWTPDTSGQFSILVTNNCTPTPGNGGTYLWDFGDGNTSTQAYPQHQYVGAGSYNLCVTVSFNGCVQTFCDTIVVINKVNAPFTINVVDPNATAIDPASEMLGSHVWPNPSTGQVQIDFELTTVADVTLRLLDLRGKEVKKLATVTLDAGLRTIGLDASACAAGIYFVELQVADAIVRHKVVIQQ